MASLWCTFKWETFCFLCFVWFCFPLICFLGFLIEGIVTLYLCNGISVNSSLYISGCQTVRLRWSSIISQQTAFTSVSRVFCFLLVFCRWENEILFLSTPNNSALAAPTQYSAKWLLFQLKTSRTFLLDENSWIYVTKQSIIDHQVSSRSVVLKLWDHAPGVVRDKKICIIILFKFLFISLWFHLLFSFFFSCCSYPSDLQGTDMGLSCCILLYSTICFTILYYH